MKLGLIFPALLFLAACSSSTTAPAPAPATGGSDDDAGADNGGETVDAAPAPNLGACGTPAPLSQCKPQNPSSVIQGVAHFDPSKLQPGSKPKLAVFLHHQFTFADVEATRGGHPHAFKQESKVDLVKGEVPFTIDLCELGTAMWSEENCGFNLVLMLDENGDNDPDNFGNKAFDPTPGEMIKMVPLTISCHAAPQCLNVNLDCTTGTSCTTFTPQTTCACSPNSCPSDDKICK